MKTLDRMLDSAIDGSFTESLFDESLLSSVESKFNHYLKSSVVSADNLKTEKEKIKELLSDISHQTKTPIANIILYTQLLDEHKLPEESRDCIRSLRIQSEKLSFLVSSLVKMSRLETGILVLNPKLNSVQSMLMDSYGQLEHKAAEKNIELTISSTNIKALFDYKWTTEAVCNLLDNAIKYTPWGGNVNISVEEYNLFCRVNITDSGMGISEDEHAKIFLRFYRSASAHEYEGVGIGLYLVRQIIVGQGGYIKVKSEIGKGSTFSMFLPVKE